MFAVLKTGGKQYRVQPGDILRVEKLAADAGDRIQFNEVLMIGATIGTPFIEDAGVQAEVIDQIKGEKVIHFVRRRRKHSSKRTRGHRQQLTLVKITEILEKGASKSGVKPALGAAAAPAAAPGAAKAKPAGKAAAKKPAGKAGAKPAKPAAAKAGTGKTAGQDDLKQLSGVGPALERKLHEAGVTTFAQIAAWTPEDVAAMDEKLSFKGRIEREGWIEQAKKLVAGKE